MSRSVAALAPLLLLVPASALAQGRPLGTGGKQPETFTLSRHVTSGAEDAARAKFAAGDCAGALDLFDQAIGHAADPALRRDRGICHERLGHSFPAIDDFRAYLSAVPHAKDADDIQARLAKLEGREAPGPDVKPEDTPPDLPKPKLSGETMYQIEADERRLGEAEGSPLRRGTGLVLGAFFGVRTLADPGASYWGIGQRVGLRLGWSPVRLNTFYVEGGWHWVDADRPSGMTGVEALIGWELRLPLDRYASHHILLGAGMGYERFVVGGTNAALSGLSWRGKLGYRFVIGPGFGLSATFDAGPLLLFGESGGDMSSFLNLGGTFGVDVAF